MPKKSHPSIPFELHQITAQQIYEKRQAESKDGNAEEDWEAARIHLYNHRNLIRLWIIQQKTSKFLKSIQVYYRRLWKSFKSLTNLIWKIISFPFWLPFKLNTLYSNTDTKEFALEITNTIISLASLIAAIIAAILIHYSSFSRKDSGLGCVNDAPYNLLL